MFTPDKHGFVWPHGTIAGGHEYLALGVNHETQTLVFLNSWGESWGRNGRFMMTFKAFAGLLQDQGDATAPVCK